MSVDVAAMVRGQLGGAFLPPPAKNVWQWAEENVFLGGAASAKAQFYDSSLTPFTRRFQECLTDPAVREVWVEKSSRTGFTEAALNVIRFKPGNLPGNTLYLTNSREDARDVSKTRLADSLREAAADHLTDDDDDFALFTTYLDNMVVKVGGSGMKGPLIQWWYDCAILDEYDDHDQTGETTTADRTRSRFTTVEIGRAKLFGLGKPNLEGGPVDVEYVMGSQEKYLVPCPLCGVRIELVWEQIRFEHCRDERSGRWDFDRVAAEARYECQACGGQFDESHKRAMNLAGEWTPTAPEKRRVLDGDVGLVAEPSRVSMQISDLYSPFPRVSWGGLGKLFILSKGNPLKRKHFVTNHLGQPWQERAAEVKEFDILMLRGGAIEPATGEPMGRRFAWCHEIDEAGRVHQAARLPIDPRLLTLTADKQQDVYKILVQAWDDTGEAWMIDRFQVLHDADLLALLELGYELPDGSALAWVDLGLVDSKYKPTEVYDLCAASDGRLYPSLGSDSVYGGKLIRIDEVEFRGEMLQRVHYNDHHLKSAYYVGRIKKRKAPRLWLPWEIDQEFAREFQAERLVKKELATGYAKWEWVKKSNQANDFGDAGKLQYLIWEMVGQQILEAAGRQDEQ